MKVFGRAVLSEFLNDRVVYRNLIPMDARLPRLDDIRQEAGLPPGRIPRKNDLDYARAIVLFLQQARQLDAPGVSIRQLVYVGDTRLSDGTAFVNICQAGGWPGLAFIASESSAPPSREILEVGDGLSLFLTNRWSALAGPCEPTFTEFCLSRGFVVDEATAVIVDLDKTAIGARGRNAQVIDQARVDAVRDTVAGLLGPTFDQSAFRSAYKQLDQVEFHTFTVDNQDYLAYICLILGSGLYSLPEIVADVRSGRLASFEQFIAQVNSQARDLPPGLEEIHREIYANVQAGDPTPFKPFRWNEYRNTIGRMGHMTDTTPVDRLLAGEIVITQEVRALALDWLERGALLFGLSDKPDEAATPTPALAAQGYLPIHRASTHVVGSN